jgi:hypothetical protein
MSEIVAASCPVPEDLGSGRKVFSGFAEPFVEAIVAMLARDPESDEMMLLEGGVARELDCSKPLSRRSVFPRLILSAKSMSVI